MSLAASEMEELLAASIGAQWTAFLDIGVAQDLSAAMGQQQEACGRALSLKSNLCAAMTDGVSVKDAQYVEMLITHDRVRTIWSAGSAIQDYHSWSCNNMSAQPWLCKF